MFLNRNQPNPKQTWYVNTTVSESKTACHHYHAPLLIHIQLPLEHPLLEAILRCLLGRWCGSRRGRHRRDGLSPLLMHGIMHAGIIHPEPFAHNRAPHTPRSLRCHLRDPHLTQCLGTPRHAAGERAVRAGGRITLVVNCALVGRDRGHAATPESKRRGVDLRGGSAAEAHTAVMVRICSSGGDGAWVGGCCSSGRRSTGLREVGGELGAAWGEGERVATIASGVRGVVGHYRGGT